MIKKETLIKKVSKAAKISVKEATTAYETILKENPSFRKQAIKTVEATTQKAVAVAGKTKIKKVEVKKEVPVAVKETVTRFKKVEYPVVVYKTKIKEIKVPVEVVKRVVKIQKVEVIKEVPVEVIKEVIKEVQVVKRVPKTVTKEVTLIKEVEVPVEVIKDKATFAKLRADNKGLNSEIDALKAELKKANANASRLRTQLDKKPKEVIREIEIIKEVPIEVVKEVEVVKQYDMKQMMAMLKKVSTKDGARKVVSENTTRGEAKEISRQSVAASDDLTKIEGIGPKIAGLLKVAGIRTFEKLSKTKVPAISKVLDAAGPRYQMHDPGSWPKQAGLAAAGEWDALEKLQDELDGGK